MMEVEKLIKEVKKYKRLFEDYALNPFSYEINGNKYYLVTYKRKEIETGYAVISLEGHLKDEYLQALPKLVLFSGASGNIFREIGSRTSVGPEFFTDIINPVDEYLKHNINSSNETLIEGLKLFIDLRKSHIETIDLYKKYEKFYDSKILKENVISDNDIEYTLEVVFKADMLQYDHSSSVYKNIKLLEQFRDEIYKINLDKKIPNESRKFLKGMLHYSENLGNELKKFEFEKSVQSLTTEEQLTKKKIEVQKSAAEFQEKVMKNLRYPLNI